MIRAQVVKACTINSAPKKPGDSVEVDENTFNNLVRKGVLKAAGPKAVKIVDVSQMTKQEPYYSADAPSLVEAQKASPKPNRRHGRIS